ncbi:MAG: TIGR03564 family F420-dependent LLM class oxidoreductase [Deltaproteobacteria bacterium]|nr:TIGR03564 family F420-dependent LLM class oxidoreductase [Deltaproteobacteria bacterium]
MRIGINGTGVSSRGSLEAVVAHAREADEQGFASYWLAQWMSVDALTGLTVIAAEAPRIELGTAVVPVHGRHPLALAMQALTTQAATRGRLQLGIGLSHRPVVEDQMGLSYQHPALYMSEYLAALDSLLRSGRAKLRGELLRCEASVVRMSETPPPLLLAALGPRILELAGSAAAGTNLWLAGPRVVREHVAPRIRQAAERAGRPQPRIVVGLPICVTDDAGRARRDVQGAFGATSEFASYQTVLAREGVRGPEDVALIGDEAQVVASIEELERAGATEFVAMELCKTRDEAQRTRKLLRGLL